MIAALYERVLRASADPVFREGRWQLLDVSAAGDGTFEQIVAYRWKSAERLAVIAANLGSSSSQAHVNIAADLDAGSAFDFHDLLTGARYRWTREALERTGLYVRLDAGDAHVFIVDPPR